jgi:hypothetical protein
MHTLRFSQDVQQAYAVFSAGNSHCYHVVETEHAVFGDGGFNFSFDGFGKAFFAESFARVGSKKEGVSAFTHSAQSVGSVRAH